MMEVFIVFFAIFVVGSVLLIRSRSGGTGSGAVDPEEHLEGGPVGYGATFSPPGTSPANEVNAPWFSRTHDQGRPQSHGPGE